MPLLHDPRAVIIINGHVAPQLTARLRTLKERRLPRLTAAEQYEMDRLLELAAHSIQ